jgi:hypothetical protein
VHAVLTRPEMVDLLTAASAYDNRKPNPAAVMAWGKAAELERWTFEEALAALHLHYASSTEFAMPAHITALIKADRQDRALREEGARQLEQSPANPAAAARIQQITDELAQQMGSRSRSPARTAMRWRVSGASARRRGRRCGRAQRMALGSTRWLSSCGRRRETGSGVAAVAGVPERPGTG